jgi:hypothetical protein
VGWVSRILINDHLRGSWDEFSASAFRAAFARHDSMHVILTGTDRTSLPKEIECTPNIRHQFFMQYSIPFPLGITVLPFCFFFFQFLRAGDLNPSHQFLPVSTSDGQLDFVLGLLVGLTRRCQLVVNIASFHWRTNRAVRRLRRRGRCSRPSQTTVVAMRSMQFILEFRRNLADHQTVLDLFGAPAKTDIVVAPIVEVTAEQVRDMLAIGEASRRSCSSFLGTKRHKSHWRHSSKTKLAEVQSR